MTNDVELRFMYLFMSLLVVLHWESVPQCSHFLVVDIWVVSTFCFLLQTVFPWTFLGIYSGVEVLIIRNAKFCFYRYCQIVFITLHTPPPQHTHTEQCIRNPISPHSFPLSGMFIFVLFLSLPFTHFIWKAQCNSINVLNQASRQTLKVVLTSHFFWVCIIAQYKQSINSESGSTSGRI